MSCKIILFCILLCSTARAVKEYHGYSVWRLDDVSIEEDLLERHNLDIWRTSHPLEVLVPPEQREPLLNDLRSKNRSFQELIPDVQKLIDQTVPKPTESDSTNFNFSRYNDYNQIVSYLNDLENTNEIVDLLHLGTTFENEPLVVVKIQLGHDLTKDTIWIDCGIHAEEWIGPATCLWGINYLTTQYNNDPLVREVLDMYNIFILPVYNVDGYKYTWSEDRLWRKNRAHRGNDECYGVDMNRNYDDGHWGGIGSSNNSCSRIYHGYRAFSETETQAVRDYFQWMLYDVTAMFSIHSFSQRWLFPFAHTYARPAEFEEINKVAEIGAAAMEGVHGHHYAHGQHFTTIYPATGTVIDWAYSVGIPYAYIVELRDMGEFGFLLPEDQIVPTAEETWTGLLTAILAIK